MNLFLIILLYFSISIQSVAALPVMPEASIVEYVPALHLDLLEDKEGQWMLADVMSTEFDDKFVISEQNVPFFRSQSVYWVRFKIEQRVEDHGNWFISIHRWVPFRFYIPTVKRGYLEKRIDPLAPFSERKIPLNMASK